MIPVRVGLRPTWSITISEPGSDAAATIQNAADEMSPGTSRDSAQSAAGRPVTDRCARALYDLARRTPASARSV